MILRIDYKKPAVTWAMGDLAPFTWLGFALESAILWYFGRGTFVLTFFRCRAEPGLTNFLVSPGIRPAASVGTMQYSGCTTLQVMHAVKLFPQRLTDPWSQPKGSEGTLIDTSHLKPSVSLGFMAYGLADLVCDLWKRGAVEIQAQFSMQLCQVLADKGLDATSFAEFTDPKVKDYNAADHLAQLTWT